MGVRLRVRARGRGSGDKVSESRWRGACGTRAGVREVRGGGWRGPGARAAGGDSRARRCGPEVQAPFPAALRPPPAAPPPQRGPGTSLPWGLPDPAPARAQTPASTLRRVPPPASPLPAVPGTQELGARLRLCSPGPGIAPGRRTSRREEEQPARAGGSPTLGALTRCAPGVRGARRPEGARRRGSRRSGGGEPGRDADRDPAGDHSVRGQWGEGWGRGAGPEEGRDLLPPTPWGARLLCAPSPLALRPGPPPTRLRTAVPGARGPPPARRPGRRR